MATFQQKITKFLAEYRGILKKDLDITAWKQKVNALGIKRTVLQHDNEIILFTKAHQVLKDFTGWLETNNNRPAWYSGIEEFYEYLKNFLAEHRIENNKVININQQASRAIVEAIQLMNMPESHKNFTSLNRIDYCGKIIAQYGTANQQQMFGKAVKDFQNQALNFSVPLLENFEKYLKEFSTVTHKTKVY